MALPPSVPTSFVPRPPTASVRYRSNFSGAFAFVGYGVLAIVIALSIGAFIYSEILITEQNTKDQQLATQVAAIDPQTATTFIRLRDRLSYSLTLLNQHVAFSGLFNVLGGILPSTVRFDSLHVSRDDAGLVQLDATGVAKSFNALAATSDAFAKDGRIKDVIFSALHVTGNAVSFTLTAAVDPSLVAFTPAASNGAPVAAPAQAAPSTGGNASSSQSTP